MTQLMGRPILELPRELGSRPVRADLFAGVRTALLGLAVVLVPVLGLWVVTPHAEADAAGAARLAGALWLLGHGAPMLRAELAAPVTVTPLLLGLFAVNRLYRAGARAGARPGLRARWSGPAAVCAGYCTVGAVVVAQCAVTGAATGALRARILPDLLVLVALAGAATAAGARSAGLPARAGAPVPTGAGPLRSAGAQFVRWLPEQARPVGGGPAVRAAVLAGLGGLLAAGALVVATAAVLDAVDGAGLTARSLAGGPGAVTGLLLLTLLLLPNAVLWGAAYALGPGFSVGTGTTVAPSGTVLGPVPEFPLLGLLPEPGAGGWRLAVCLLPALAAVLPALLLGRAAAGTGTGRLPWHPVATAVAAVSAALLVGGAAATAGWLSGGSLAGGRMAELGPVPWRTGLAAAAWFTVVAAPLALLTRATALGAAAALHAAATARAHRVRLLAHAAVVRLGTLPGPRGR
ncbi:cell division protein PerM [Kitasatospora sp. NPDC054939]